MQYVDDEWKEKLYLTLREAEMDGWFTTRLAILMAEGIGGAQYPTSKQVAEMRERIYTTVLRERLNGESEPK